MPKKDDKVILTQEGLNNLKKEHEDLKQRRHEVAERLEEAIALGDLSENAEYADAKEEQALVEARIAEIEQMLRHVEIIELEKEGKGHNRVNVGSTVVVQREDKKESETYTIVGRLEVDSLGGKISNESPLGSALLSKKKGDKVKVEAPAGDFSYSIVEIK